MTVVKDDAESVAKLSGKKKKMKLKMRDHSQEEGKVFDKSTISAAKNITREHVWIIMCAIKERSVWNKYFDSGLTQNVIPEIFDMALCLFSFLVVHFTSILRLLVWKLEGVPTV